MNVFYRLVKKFTQGINVMVVLFAIAMMVIGIMQILFRYVFRSSLSWSEECMRYLHVWLTAIGGSLCFYEGMFTTINIISEQIKKRTKLGGKALVILQYVLPIVFYGIMLYFGIKSCQTSWIKVSSTTRISMGIIYMCIPLSGFFGLVFSAAKLPTFWNQLRGKEEIT